MRKARVDAGVQRGSVFSRSFRAGLAKGIGGAKGGEDDLLGREAADRL
ncbi:hypothetical protein VU07_01490 [Desulfobulbus sp. F4]|nr:hypothetical protein [Desulfobulbus sp. F4]